MSKKVPGVIWVWWSEILETWCCIECRNDAPLRAAPFVPQEDLVEAQNLLHQANKRLDAYRTTIYQTDPTPPFLAVYGADEPIPTISTESLAALLDRVATLKREVERLSAPDLAIQRVCKSVRDCVRCEEEAANYCDECAIEFARDAPPEDTP